ncbi:hypothetical protein J2S09_002346 [Bacillus fengqiuensis]|nr:hypothetical protein [Bacillus fengqiuensis]
MQIQNQLWTSNIKPKEKGSFQAGDMLKATVKETISDTEALVQVNGKEVKMKFDQPVKADQQVHVQVKGTNGDTVEVKTLPSPTEKASPPQTASQTLSGLGADLSNKPLKQAMTSLLQQGYPLTKENVKQLETFWKEAGGTTGEKLQTIEAMALKKLEITPVQLKAVHEALHGDGMNRVIQQGLQEGTFEAGLDKEAIALIKKALSDFIRSNPSSSAEKAEKLQRLEQLLKRNLNVKDVFLEAKQLLGDRAVSEMEKALKIFHTGQERFIQSLQSLTSSNAAQILLQQLQQQSLLKMGTESIGGLLQQAVQSPVELESLTNTLNDSIKLQDIALKQFLQQLQNGMMNEMPEDGWRQSIDKMEKMIQKEPNVQAIIQFVKENLLGELDGPVKEKVMNHLELAEGQAAEQKELGARKELASLVQLLKEEGGTLLLPEEASLHEEMAPIAQGMSKDFIVTTITKKLAQAAADFKTMQKEAMRHLSAIEQSLDNRAPTGRIQARQLLETVIKNLDQAIMKSDFMLYADMKTEKSMLEASTLLQQAKKLLAKGETQDSLQVVKQVKAMMQEVNFKPSETKMMHMVKQEWGQASPLGNALSLANQQDGSARQVLEMMRQLGLNREHDLAGQLASKQAVTQQDVKSALWQMAGDQGKMPQLLEQALQHVTGQQLLSKQDTQGNLQHMFFQLPYLLQNEVKDVKVYVNSQKQNEKVDWENCSLYFLFETKKMGDVGILLNAVDRKLSITFKNDDETFPQKSEPLADRLKEKVSDIGYLVSGIQHQALTVRQEETEQEDQMASRPAHFSLKGFDYSI